MRLLFVVLLALLAGCSPARPYETVVDGTKLNVDTEKRVIRDGLYEYPYVLVDDIKEVIYPDGVVYREQNGVASYNGKHDERYVDGKTLVSALDGAGTGFLGALPPVLIVIGLVHLVSPDMAWHLSRAYVLFRGEPGAKARLVTRIAGLGAVLAGFLMLLA